MDYYIRTVVSHYNGMGEVVSTQEAYFVYQLAQDDYSLVFDVKQATRFKSRIDASEAIQKWMSGKGQESSFLLDVICDLHH